MMRLLVALLALLFAGSWPCARAHAQAASADAAIARGVQLRKQGRNAEALAEFQSAYASQPSPRALAQVALAEQALGHWVAAEAGLLRALEAATDAWITHNQAALSQALDTTRAHLARLYIETDADGANLLVAGQAVGTSPLTAAIRVPAGEVHVEANLAGRQPRSQQVSLAPGSEVHVRLELPRLPDSGPSQPAAAEPAANAELDQASAPQAPIAPPRWSLQRAAAVDGSSTGSGMRTGGVIALVAGGALLAGAVTAHGVREYHAAKLKDLSYCSSAFDCTRHYETARTAQTLAIVGYSAAGAAILTGVLLLVLAPEAGYASSVRLEPGVAPGWVGLQLTAAY